MSAFIPSSLYGVIGWPLAQSLSPLLHNTAFQALGISEEDIQERFGHLVNAFKFGAPPHGGLAYGLDRLCMLMAGAPSIRDVIAFPKTQKATCLMTEAPSTVSARQLRELGLRLRETDKEAAKPAENAQA